MAGAVVWRAARALAGSAAVGLGAASVVAACEPTHEASEIPLSELYAMSASLRRVSDNLGAGVAGDAGDTVEDLLRDVQRSVSAIEASLNISRCTTCTGGCRCGADCARASPCTASACKQASGVDCHEATAAAPTRCGCHASGPTAAAAGVEAATGTPEGGAMVPAGSTAVAEPAEQDSEDEVDEDAGAAAPYDLYAAWVSGNTPRIV
eukprot:CAMPEP_0203809088 /NCGR_PEP_ID=MMETSP0115-20131106/2041_1 /ASSEMBLY_ACC=CAM_ASM_000227 /TAXON_ID=33651 /ORGANISM="Bicosoecid sp, Strain ms1" /LENGTH=207 /DNA_ID=CAMNT_0050717801 /DNA_START=43 /DNA_END=666 /DNA_ORIENTATION=+